METTYISVGDPDFAFKEQEIAGFKDGMSTRSLQSPPPESAEVNPESGVAHTLTLVFS